MIRNYQLAFDTNMKADNQTRSTFDFEVHYITNYISRFFRTHKQHKIQYKNTDKNKRISTLITLIGSQNNETKRYTEEKIITNYLSISYQEISVLRKEERTNKILDIILQSAHYFEEYLPNIVLVFKEAVKSFKENKDRNIWIHKKKQLKGIGTAQLVCELTMFEFILDFIVVRKDQATIYKKNILRTMPDSIFYYQKFNDLIINESEVSVTDRIYKKSFFTVPLNELNKALNNDMIVLSEENSKYSSKINPKDPEWWNKFKASIEKN